MHIQVKTQGRQRKALEGAESADFGQGVVSQALSLSTLCQVFMIPS